MFTRKRWNPPTVPQGLDADVQRYLRELNKSVSDYLLSLEAKGSLTIGEAEINANQGIKFPATAVASTGANTLDDFERNSYTPTVTAGSGSFTSASATGYYMKIANCYFFKATVTITTNGTAAGTVDITLPDTPSGTALAWGRENNTTGNMIQGHCINSQTMKLRDYANNYPGGSGYSIQVEGFFFV